MAHLFSAVAAVDPRSAGGQLLRAVSGSCGGGTEGSIFAGGSSLRVIVCMPLHITNLVLYLPPPHQKLLQLHVDNGEMLDKK